MFHPRVLPALPLIALCLVPDGIRLHAASFDCSKASSRVEQMICQDEEVSALDEHLARYYQGARMALGRGADCLKADQREWLANVRGRCADRHCLRNAYLARLAELDGLQPGATAIRNIELPEGPQMMGILPPAEDEVAAPRKTNATPVEISGQIVDELESGDGFVLRDEQGKSHLLRPLMFIEPEDADLLAAAARKPESAYLVRGFLQPGEESSLDVSRCAYVYRLPPARR
jgi:uncharacterized protein